MPIAITGAKYATASVSTVGTSTVIVSTAPFVQADFTKTRLLGLWSSGSVFKGMAWARRWVSTSQIELERPFFDPATGQTVTQAVGDQVLVSKDFSESAVAGLAVSGRVVSITDTCTFGVNGNQMGTCLYDENKLVNATVGTLLSGGLVVFGKLDDYATDSVSSSIDWQSTNANPILCNDAAVNFCGYGGRWEAVPAGGGGAYFIGGNNQGTAGNTVVLTGIECPNDLLTNTAGGAWARNPTRHQLINCYSVTTSTNAIMRRWGNGIIRGGQYKFPNNTNQPISAFGSDSAGTYTVAANSGDRAVILDMGNGPALVRNNSPVAMTFNFTNLITTDFRSVTGAGGSLPPNPNGINTFRFSDNYTNLQAGTVGVVLNNSGAVADSIASSNSSWSPSLLRRTCVGATVTVNATSWTYGFKRYGFQAVGGTITPTTYDLGTAGQADNVAFGGAVNQLADAGVTLTQSAAAALTQINTLDQFYDAGINWGTVSTSNAQYPSLGAYPVSFAGTVLDLGSRNLIVDGTAAQAFAINTSTNTITVKSLALAAGAKFRSLSTTGTVTFANGGTITAPYVDASGVKASITNLDPQGFGTTWVFGWLTTANYNGRNPAQPPASWTGWSQSSGTGNTTQVTLAPSTEYQLFLRVPGYFAPIGPIATIDTTTQTSVSLPVIVDTDLTGNTLWPQTAAHMTQAAKFTYDIGDQVVEYDNQTGATEYITFLAAYRALELIAKAPGMAYQLIQPLYVNGTKDGFTLPRTNPLKARMSDASTGSGILQADIAYSDNQAKAFDRFLANSQNAGGYLLIPQATAGISSSTVADIRSGLALEATVATKASQATVDALGTPAQAAALTALASTNQTEHDATQGLIAALPAPLNSTQTQAAAAAALVAYDGVVPADLAGLALEATVATRATQTSVNAIPTNPILTTDVRLNNLDAAISTRSTLTAPQVRTELATELGRIDATVSSRSTQSSVTAIPTNPLLTNDARVSNLDATVSSRLASSAYVAAPTLASIRADIERTGGMLDTVPTLAEVEASTVLAKQSGFTGLATATNVTNAQTAIVGEVNANETKIDAVKADTAAIKAKTDTLVNTVAPTAAQIRAEMEAVGGKLDTTFKTAKTVRIQTL